MQFGFMRSKGIIDVLCIETRMQKECRKKVICPFCRYEAFDRVARNVTEWVMSKNGLPQVIVKVVMSLSYRVKTKVR